MPTVLEAVADLNPAAAFWLYKLLSH